MSAEPAFVAEIDEPRTLPNQKKILAVMIDEVWRTYDEIGEATSLPPQTIGSHLRNLRMEKGGGYVLCRRPRLRREAGLYEYQMLPPGSISEFDSSLARTAAGKGFIAGFVHAVRIAAAADREFVKTAAGLAVKKEVTRYYVTA